MRNKPNTQDWKPQTLTFLEVAFPTDVSRLMPSKTDIPDQFWGAANPYSRLVSTWFSRGLNTGELVAVAEIDKQQGIRHLRAILGSFGPQHEYKIAALAYLVSLWFTIPAKYYPKGRR